MISDATIWLLAESSLDRSAYTLLLRTELGIEPKLQSDFEPVRLWDALRANPDLAVILADRPTQPVKDACQMIPRLRPRTRRLIVSAAVNPDELQAWGRCECDGYVVKDSGIEEIGHAIKTLLKGDAYYSHGVRPTIEHGRNNNGLAAKLTRREAELLPLLARGLTLREAAGEMTVSYKTADSYRTSLLKKLGVRDRVELVKYAIRENIIEI
ncbi:MAG: response regulator transcription factor [Phycisphaerales bacterium]|nr:response regulator transcription factor [Phycisphaerales bacterium]